MIEPVDAYCFQNDRGERRWPVWAGPPRLDTSRTRQNSACSRSLEPISPGIRFPLPEALREAPPNSAPAAINSGPIQDPSCPYSEIREPGGGEGSSSSRVCACRRIFDKNTRRADIRRDLAFFNCIHAVEFDKNAQRKGTYTAGFNPCFQVIPCAKAIVIAVLFELIHAGQPGMARLELVLVWGTSGGVTRRIEPVKNVKGTSIR